MKLSYFPQIKVVHTSKIFHGQLYIPMLNWILMVGTILIAAIYNNVCYNPAHSPADANLTRPPLSEMPMGECQPFMPILSF